MPLSTTGYPILSQASRGLDLSGYTQKIRTGDDPNGLYTADAIDEISDQVNGMIKTLQQTSPSLTEFIVQDAQGNVLLKAGTFIEGSLSYDGLWTVREWIGGNGAGTAPFFTDDLGHVVVGQNLYGAQALMFVLDPYGRTAAMLGTQFDCFPVTGAIDNGSGAIRLTVVAHKYITGDTAYISDVGGVPNATGPWPVTVIGVHTIDLDNSYFAGTYTSGGVASRSLHVSGAANNGSGLIRLTVTAHGYVTGDQVNVIAVGGVPNATGQWVIKVIDVNHFDLIASTWGGGYTSGGVVLRYFGGGLFETVSVAGTTFANAKLRALANGDLLIRDALITLVGTGAGSSTITLDPNLGTITVAANPASTLVTTIGASGIGVGSTVAHNSGVFIDNNNISIYADVDGVAVSGPSVNIISSEVALSDSANLITIALNGATGNASVKSLDVAGSHVIDDTLHAKNLASVDSSVYKVGGVNGGGVIYTVVTGVDFTLHTVTTKTVTVNSGLTMSAI